MGKVKTKLSYEMVETLHYIFKQELHQTLYDETNVLINLLFELFDEIKLILELFLLKKDYEPQKKYGISFTPAQFEAIKILLSLVDLKSVLNRNAYLYTVFYKLQSEFECLSFENQQKALASTPSIYIE